MEYNETVKKLERYLVRHESGDVSLGEFTLPKGLQHRQYIGIAAMFVAMDWGLQVNTNTYTCTCHGEPARFNAQSKQSLGTWSCRVSGKKATVKREKVGTREVKAK